MRSKTTAQFRKRLAALPEEVQEQAREAYRQFKRDPYHKSLRFKRVHTNEPLYSARISKGYRAVGQREGNLVHVSEPLAGVLRWLGIALIPLEREPIARRRFSTKAEGRMAVLTFTGGDRPSAALVAAYASPMEYEAAAPDHPSILKSSTAHRTRVAPGPNVPSPAPDGLRPG